MKNVKITHIRLASKEFKIACANMKYSFKLWHEYH
jgi:hypothetical protein